jgi:hypothetical protein
MLLQLFPVLKHLEAKPDNNVETAVKCWLKKTEHWFYEQETEKLILEYKYFMLHKDYEHSWNVIQ